MKTKVALLIAGVAWIQGSTAWSVGLKGGGAGPWARPAYAVKSRLGDNNSLARTIGRTSDGKEFLVVSTELVSKSALDDRRGARFYWVNSQTGAVTLSKNLLPGAKKLVRQRNTEKGKRTGRLAAEIRVERGVFRNVVTERGNVRIHDGQRSRIALVGTNGEFRGIQDDPADGHPTNWSR